MVEQQAIQSVGGGSIPPSSLHPFVVQKETKRNGLVYVMQIDKGEGRKLIIDNHYSHTSVNTSNIFLGLFSSKNDSDTLLGVASFGVAMNPRPTTKLVLGTQLDEYLELNRLWVTDDVGNNIETVFLGLCWRWLKKEKPKVKWIQSFADGRVGVGTIYQAANFLYCGFHLSKFWKDSVTGKVYHNSILTRKTRKKYWELQPYLNRLVPFIVKTYRYIYFLDASYKTKLTLSVLPYPKRVME